MAILLGPLIASADETPASYLVAGLKSARIGEFQAAIPPLLLSYQSKPETLTAFVLSVCFAHVYDYDKAEEYGLNALEGSPPLPITYVESEKQILSWILGARAGQSPAMVTTVTMSIPTSTKDVNLQRGQLRAQQLERQAEDSKRDALDRRVNKYLDVTRIILLTASNPCAGPILDANQMRFCYSEPQQAIVPAVSLPEQ